MPSRAELPQNRARRQPACLNSCIGEPCQQRNRRRGCARTGVPKDKVEDVEVLGAEHVAVAAAVVAVAVQDGRAGRAEHQHVDALGHVPPVHSMEMLIER